MGNNRTFLRFFMYAPILIAHAQIHLHKIPPHAHNKPLRNHIIIYIKILTKTYLYKRTPCANYTHIILVLFNIQKYFAPACYLHQKISYKEKISQYIQLNPSTIHISSYFSTYDNISTPDWMDSNIDSIKSDCFHFLLRSNILILSNNNYKSLHAP